MRRRLLALGVLGVVVLGGVVFFAFRSRASEPTPDRIQSADSRSNAPPPLASPGLAPAPGTSRGALPREPLDPVPPPAPPIPGPARIEGTVVTAEANVPIPLLKLHLAFRKEHGSTPLTLDVETGHDGTFAGDLETSEPIPLADGWSDRQGLQFRGFRRSVDDGTDPETDVVARPGETLRVVLRMARTATWKGIVVDDEDQPLAGVRVGVFMPGPNDSPYGSGLMTETNVEGRFTVSALAEPDRVTSSSTASAAGRLTVSDMSRAMRPSLAIDLRTIPESEREHMRVVFSRGRRVQGRLVDEGGRPLADIHVLATYGDPSRLRAAKTDVDGRFTLEALAGGAVTIGCFLADRDLEARVDTALLTDVEDLLLVAKPVDPGDAKRGYVVLGARLVDVTEEMRVARDLHASVRVLVVDRGAGGAFGDEAGVDAGILYIGDSKVVDVAHLVDLLIAEKKLAEQANPDFPMIRIVTTWGEGKHRGTNTQFFGLGPHAVEHLTRLRDRFRATR